MVKLPSFGRVDASRRSAGLAVGDALAIAAFVVAGEIRHGGTLSTGLLTYAEFLVGWVIVAIGLGAYGPDAIESLPRAIAIGGIAWIGSALLGQVVRAVVEPGFSVAPAFVLVSIVFGGALVVGWRAIAAWRL